MLKIFLINMPFAALPVPSLALTQLEAVVDSEYAGRVDTEIVYLNHDFVHFIGGIDDYAFPLSLDAVGAGLGEWFFRQAAFPDAPDNAEEYFRRYYPARDEKGHAFRRRILEKRAGLDRFLDEMVEKHRLDQGAIVGFTTLFSQCTAGFAMARKLKERNPGIITIMGGAPCDPPTGQEIARRIGQIDFVFCGPALKSFPEFVGRRLAGDMDACHRIPGVLSRENCSTAWDPEKSPDGPGAFMAVERDIDIAVGAWMGEERDINVPIELNYDSFLDSLDRNFPNGEVAPVLLFQTSRGCWWGERSQCTFCGLNGMSVRYGEMSPENALRQFESLFRYASRCRRFDSVDNICPKSYFTNLFPLLDTPREVMIWYEVRADLEERDLEALSGARVKAVQPGVEALATSTLKLMGKGTTAFRNIMLLKDCLMHDVYPVWNLLVGFPGEEECVYEKYLRDMPLLVHLPPPVGVYPISFGRYSHYFQHGEKYGMDLRPYDYYALVYPFEEDAVINLAYYFLDHNGSGEYVVNLNRWYDRLKTAMDVWLSKWKDAGLAPASSPKLYLKRRGDDVFVLDSRSGEKREHPVGDLGLKVLERLAKPAGVPRLVEELSEALGVSGKAIDRAFASLLDAGFLFQEKDRFLSLVLPKEPPPVTYLRLQAGKPALDPEEKSGPGGSGAPALVRRSRNARRMQAGRS